MSPSLPQLSMAQLEILLQALDPRLDGFGEGQSCFDDAGAFLARLGFNDGHGESDLSALLQWLSAWRSAGGTRTTLALAVEALLSQQRQQSQAQEIELVWSGPDWGVGAQMRDQSVLIQQLVEHAEQRLLLTTYAFYKGPFIEKLFDLIKARMVDHPGLDVRLICNIKRQHGDSARPDVLVAKFRDQTWSRLWKAKPGEASPKVFYDPRSVQLDAMAVCHVKAVVADDQVLVTSANLTDAAQLRNFELGVRIDSQSHADAIWLHFDQLIHKGLLVPLDIANRSMR
jgi:phosphatidylserine/phosphatidylglycerophosphate/cardiolipin synthase-like enzyme